MTSHTGKHRPAIEAVLNPGERLEWSGGPDQEVMKKTLGRRRRRFPLLGVAVLAIIAVIAFSSSEDLDSSGLLAAAGGQVAGGFDPAYLGLLLVPVFAGLILYLNRRQASEHVENLSFGITDQRVLIVRKGEVIESWSPAELQHYEMNERIGATGFHDIIWDHRPVPSSSDERPSPLQIERSRVGFKALADGPAVLSLLDAWRTRHTGEAEQDARSLLAQDATDSGAFERLRHPASGFSIECPVRWQTQVRRKKVIFGKFGIDTTQNDWYMPERDSDWNVVLTKDATNSEVLLEVAQTPPTVTLKSMTESRALKTFARDAEILAEQADLEIGGLEGFAFSMRLPSRYRQMVASPGQVQRNARDRDDERFIVIHQAVVHDGRRQFYLRAIWEDGADLQEQVCRRIIGSLQA